MTEIVTHKGKSLQVRLNPQGETIELHGGRNHQVLLAGSSVSLEPSDDGLSCAFRCPEYSGDLVLCFEDLGDHYEVKSPMFESEPIADNLENLIFDFRVALNGKL